jgi:hypothetical protein
VIRQPVQDRDGAGGVGPDEALDRPGRDRRVALAHVGGEERGAARCRADRASEQCTPRRSGGTPGSSGPWVVDPNARGEHLRAQGSLDPADERRHRCPVRGLVGRIELGEPANAAVRLRGRPEGRDAPAVG